jgi:uncharacterized repeat protein (TIGR03843 family)
MSEQDDPKQPQSSVPLSMERVLEILDKGTLDTEHGSIRWSSNYTFLISVCHEDVSLMAVYKPQKGERPLWDFPDGTLCYRERSAFLTSEVLGWQIVPPTVLRAGPRGLGSIQFFVDHDPEFHYFNFDESYLPQLRKLSLFDYLVNNADRKGGHCLVDADNHLWGIDHGITFHASHKLRTVVWNFAGQPVPDELLDDVQKLCNEMNNPQSAYRKELSNLLHASEIRSFQRRIDKIMANKVYPEPGPGPNYPWPPV